MNGVGRERPEPGRPVGPTITGVIDCRDAENPLDGFVIEEGALAAALAPFLQPMLELWVSVTAPVGRPLRRTASGVPTRSRRRLQPGSTQPSPCSCLGTRTLRQEECRNTHASARVGRRDCRGRPPH